MGQEVRVEVAESLPGPLLTPGVLVHTASLGEVVSDLRTSYIGVKIALFSFQKDVSVVGEITRRLSFSAQPQVSRQADCMKSKNSLLGILPLPGSSLLMKKSSSRRQPPFSFHFPQNSDLSSAALALPSGPGNLGCIS